MIFFTFSKSKNYNYLHNINYTYFAIKSYLFSYGSNALTFKIENNIKFYVGIDKFKKDISYHKLNLT